MLKSERDAVIIQSELYENVTINANTMCLYDEITGMYNVVASIRGKVGELGGEIKLYTVFGIKAEEKADQICQQFIKDVQIMSLNRPEEYKAYLVATEIIAEHLPVNTAAIGSLYILFSIPHKYLRSENVFLYRN